MKIKYFPKLILTFITFIDFHVCVHMCVHMDINVPQCICKGQRTICGSSWHCVGSRDGTPSSPGLNWILKCWMHYWDIFLYTINIWDIWVVRCVCMCDMCMYYNACISGYAEKGSVFEYKCSPLSLLNTKEWKEFGVSASLSQNSITPNSNKISNFNLHIPKHFKKHIITTNIFLRNS